MSVILPSSPENFKWSMDCREKTKLWRCCECGRRNVYSPTITRCMEKMANLPEFAPELKCTHDRCTECQWKFSRHPPGPETRATSVPSETPLAQQRPCPKPRLAGTHDTSNTMPEPEPYPISGKHLPTQPKRLTYGMESQPLPKPPPIRNGSNSSASINGGAMLEPNDTNPPPPPPPPKRLIYGMEPFPPPPDLPPNSNPPDPAPPAPSRRTAKRNGRPRGRTNRRTKPLSDISERPSPPETAAPAPAPATPIAPPPPVRSSKRPGHQGSNFYAPISPGGGMAPSSDDDGW